MDDLAQIVLDGHTVVIGAGLRQAFAGRIEQSQETVESETLAGLIKALRQAMKASQASQAAPGAAAGT